MVLGSFQHKSTLLKYGSRVIALSGLYMNIYLGNGAYYDNYRKDITQLIKVI